MWPYEYTMRTVLLLDDDDIIEPTDTVCIPGFHQKKYAGGGWYDIPEIASEMCPAYVGKPKRELDDIYRLNCLTTEIRRWP